jgi:hypothetical protein
LRAAGGPQRLATDPELEMNSPLLLAHRQISVAILRIPRPTGARLKRRVCARLAGFTLIEQIVVIGLVVALVGLLSSALNDRAGHGIELQTAQATAAGMLRLAQVEAMTSQASVRLLVFISSATSDGPQINLRGLQVVRADPAGGSSWIAATDVIFLPRAVCVVPPAVLPAQLCEGILWPTGPGAPISTLLGPERITVGATDPGNAFYLELSPDGKPNPATTQLAFATVRQSAGALSRFDDPLAVRGLILRTSGETTPINDALGF